jgi:NADH:ubiquinone oxidoreductase subunit F (NADH-binding)
MDGTALDRWGRVEPHPTGAELRVRVWPGLAPAASLLGGDRRCVARPAPVTVDVDRLAGLAEAAQLRGRGGAGFPFAVKLRTVDQHARTSNRPAVAVLNGEEGEPASAKDRVLMTLRPELALQGLVLVAGALGAERAFAYVSDRLSRERLTTVALATAAARHGDLAGLHVVDAPAGYVSGEESAVVRALSGGPAKPTHKPPRPFEAGVDGLPTLVSNVETLAHLARLVEDGGRHTPSVLLTLVSDRGDRVVVEVPETVTLREVLIWQGLDPGHDRYDVLLGGFFGQLIKARTLWRTVRDLASRQYADSLGCGVVLVLHDTCPVTAVAEILHHLDLQNARQCGPCFKGIPSMAGVVDDLAHGRAGREDLVRLAGWGTGLRGRGACGTLDAACGVVSSLLERRGELVARHLTKPCRRCAEHPERPPATSFAVPWPADIKEQT